MVSFTKINHPLSYRTEDYKPPLEILPFSLFFKETEAGTITK